MSDRVRTPMDKAKRLRAKVRARVERRAEHRHEHQGMLRDLADLAMRVLRRRRYGDDRYDR